MSCQHRARVASRAGGGTWIIPAGTTRTLSGVQQFDHICIGGTLRGKGSLTLVARTIDVAPTGQISLDGRSPLPFLWSDAGRYAVGGACAADHGAAHGGLRGPATGPGHSATGISEIPDLTPRPGEGGGRLTLIAGTLAIDGQVRAGGGSGQDAFSVANVDGMETWTGSGGGSGGGITIYAHRLALYGRVGARRRRGRAGERTRPRRWAARLRRLREGVRGPDRRCSGIAARGGVGDRRCARSRRPGSAARWYR